MSKVVGVLKGQDKKLVLLPGFYELCNSVYITFFFFLSSQLCVHAYLYICVCAHVKIQISRSQGNDNRI